VAFTLLLLLARNILADEEASHMAQACELETFWETSPGIQGVDLPLSFSEAELQIIGGGLGIAASGMVTMQRVRASLGDLYPEQGDVAACLAERSSRRIISDCESAAIWVS
jgi:hypothetical protein